MENLQAICNSFNESQDKVHVTELYQPLDGFEAKVYEAAANGTGPDIVMLQAAAASDYASADLIIDFANYIDVEEYKTRVGEGFYAASTDFPNGGLYGLAVTATAPVFFYNKTMYDQFGLTAPTTWDELYNNAKTIYEGTDGKVCGFCADDLSAVATAFMEQNGIDFVSADKKVDQWNDPKFVEFLKWWQEACLAGYFQVAPTAGDYNSSDMGAAVLASYIGSCAGLNYVKLPEGNELACAPMPQTEGGKPYAISWSRFFIGFKKDQAGHDQSVADFIIYFTKNCTKYVIDYSASAPYADIQATPEYQEYLAGNIALAAVAEQSSYSYGLPNATGVNNVQNALRALMKQVGTGSDITEVLTQAIATSNAALAE
ncbi:MAG: extracellular solute-binding protein [Erysipelotrichaceae bacterium]|nr:extracellular solute-binding protein [Erysipelotrichaceae bacterium]